MKALGSTKDSADHDDLCIDDDGLVVRGEGTLQGKVSLRRMVTAQEIAPLGRCSRSRARTTTAAPHASSSKVCAT